MIGNIFTALRQGYLLRDPKTWKNRTLAVNAIAAIIAAVLAASKHFGLELGLSDEQIVAVAELVFIAFCLFNGWSVVATSDKVGVRSRSGTAGGPGSAEKRGDAVREILEP